tara:strand:+ start:948 stop:1958 length:1011 start_codon:yes stop_codon:yes gene_type:complete
MATIRKHYGKWQVLIRKKSVNLSRVFTKLSLASEWAKDIETQITNGTYQDLSDLVKMSVKELLNLYYDHAKSKTEHSDRLKYEIAKVSRYPIGDLRLGYLSGKHVANMRDEMLDEGLSPSTVRKYMGLLQRAINTGRKELGIPLTHDAVALAKKPPESPSRDRVLTEEEWNSLLAACETSSVYFMKEFVIVARETMTRRSELLNLTKYDVNFDNYTAFIPKTKNGTPRHIGLSPRAIEVLKSLPLAVDGRYFPLNMFSPKYAKNNFSKAFARCVKKAGLENFRLHDCRHISATLAAEDGWTISELSAQGGWKSLSQLKRYTHVRAEKLAAKMRNMA